MRYFFERSDNEILTIIQITIERRDLRAFIFHIVRFWYLSLILIYFQYLYLQDRKRIEGIYPQRYYEILRIKVSNDKTRLFSRKLLSLVLFIVRVTYNAVGSGAKQKSENISSRGKMKKKKKLKRFAWKTRR